jgi:hemolysin activation/secretion protein
MYFFSKFLNSEFPSNKIEVDFNQFFEMKNERDILGIRAYGGFGIGDLSFNQQFVIGNNDIRGYSQGKYRGELTLALQGEYRWNPWRKIGLVGFAGVATIFSGINEDHNGKILPGLGTGFRYNVFQKTI